LFIEVPGTFTRSLSFVWNLSHRNIVSFLLLF